MRQSNILSIFSGVGLGIIGLTLLAGPITDVFGIPSEFMQRFIAIVVVVACFGIMVLATLVRNKTV